MKTLRRFDIRNAYYFVTAVTLERRPILIESQEIFLSSWQPVPPVAWVLLPDHFHALIKVEAVSISESMHTFKRNFRYKYQGTHRTGRIWQHRFWDHTIRDENDFVHHLNYIHFNPVKHGLVKRPGEYTLSSFSLWEAQGYYDDVLDGDPPTLIDGNYGE